MRTIHDLKIREEFANHVVDGSKTFEIRENDRGFQPGDLVRFKVVDPDTFIFTSGDNPHISHEIENYLYKITYVISGWGLKDGYVVFGITREDPPTAATEGGDGQGHYLSESGNE